MIIHGLMMARPTPQSIAEKPLSWQIMNVFEKKLGYWDVLAIVKKMEALEASMRDPSLTQISPQAEAVRMNDKLQVIADKVDILPVRSMGRRKQRGQEFISKQDVMKVISESGFIIVSRV